MGLNENLTNIGGQLLMMNPMPKITQVLGLLQQDERQGNYSHLHNAPIESAALMSKNVSGNFGNKFVKNENKKTVVNAESKGNRFQGKKSNLECSHCHGTNHTRERCYHLIGFPPRNKPNSNA